MRACLLFVLLFSAESVSAETISGTVYDPAGSVVVGARVILMVDYVKLAETTSGSTGEFTFENLRPQLYHVQIKQPRFSLYQSHVDLQARHNAHLYAVLPLANMDEVLEIRGERMKAGATVSGVKTPRVGGRLEPARPARRVMPTYPSHAQETGVTGRVAIHIRITAEGNVAEPLVLDSPDPALTTAALAAVNQWTYEPMRLNGVSVACDATIVLEFGAR